VLQYKLYFNGKKFVFEGEGVKAMDDNVHALMPKIKRLKIGVEPANVPKIPDMGRRRRAVAQGGK
jgi:hypothetical protein